MPNLQRVFAMKISSVYPFYVQKAEKKGRTQAEVDRLICWLTGYTQAGLEKRLELTVRSRPIPAGRIAPKRPDGEPLIFLFRFNEGAVRDLTDPARSRWP